MNFFKIFKTKCSGTTNGGLLFLLWKIKQMKYTPHILGWQSISREVNFLFITVANFSRLCNSRRKLEYLTSTKMLYQAIRSVSDFSPVWSLNKVINEKLIYFNAILIAKIKNEQFQQNSKNTKIIKQFTHL